MAKYLDDTMFSEYKAFLYQDGKLLASILSSTWASLDLWSDPEIVKLTVTKAVLISGNRRPLIIGMKPYFKGWKLKTLKDKNPYKFETNYPDKTACYLELNKKL